MLNEEVEGWINSDQSEAEDRSALSTWLYSTHTYEEIYVHLTTVLVMHLSSPLGTPSTT